MTTQFDAILWTTSEYQYGEYMRVKTDRERLHNIHISTTDYDMSTRGWVKVGTAFITPTFFPPADTVSAAVAAVDIQIKKLMAEQAIQLQQLKDYRQTLLSLEAPK